MTAALEIYRRVSPLLALAVLPLLALLALQSGQTRHWKGESGRYEKLYRGAVAAHAGTVASYRTAAEAARAADRANADRVAGEIQLNNERTKDDYEKRLAAARAAADRLRLELAGSGADPGGSRGAAMPGVPGPAGGAPASSGQNGLSIGDRLTATEQAIQLDELIKWVRRVGSIDVNRNGGEK